MPPAYLTLFGSVLRQPALLPKNQNTISISQYVRRPLRGCSPRIRTLFRCLVIEGALCNAPRPAGSFSLPSRRRHPVTRPQPTTRGTTMGNANSFPRPEDDFYTKCGDFHDQNGSLLVQQIGRGLQWVTFVVSWFQLAFYGQSVKSTLGWEETYVCVVEAIKITFDIFFMYSTPATIYQTNGNTVSWLTYSEWLLTCPVILVQLCNITGLESDFSNRTMQVLVSDVGAIVMGTYAAFSAGWLKAVFFLLGCSYGAFTFYHAAKVYIESYYMVPKGLCRNLVKAMAWCFFTSWVGFPIIFLAGPDGFGHLSIWAEVAAQQICEIFSKNVWGFLGHFLRVKIHEFIIIHGDCRKLSKVKFAGKELMVMSYVEKDGNDTI
nr:protein 67 [synthetic construct]